MKNPKVQKKIKITLACTEGHIINPLAHFPVGVSSSEYPGLYLGSATLSDGTVLLRYSCYSKCYVKEALTYLVRLWVKEHGHSMEDVIIEDLI